MEAQRVRGGVVPIVLNLCTRWVWMVNAASRPLYPLVRPWYPLYGTGRFMGPSADLEGYGEEEICCSYWGSNPKSSSLWQVALLTELSCILFK